VKLLYSNILPLKTQEGQEKFSDAFSDSMARADTVDIAVGYVSKASLIELSSLVKQHCISHVSLIKGMYYIEGMPEGTYHTAKALHQEWTDHNCGEVRLVRPLKYHGKAYLFSKDGSPFRAFIGSHNLGAIKTEASNIRQYEISAATEDPAELAEIAKFTASLKARNVSLPISEIRGITLFRETNTSLTGVDAVTPIPPTEADVYRRHETEVTFVLPIKVPAYAERHMDDGKHFTKSNLNVCYAAPRSARKARNWYETQFTVAKEITRLPGYPDKNVAFFAVTDDGYTFKAHTTSDGNKQFSAVGDELIMGRWIKGRIVRRTYISQENSRSLVSFQQNRLSRRLALRC
jgi:hypothetical protein